MKGQEKFEKKRNLFTSARVERIKVVLLSRLAKLKIARGYRCG